MTQKHEVKKQAGSLHEQSPRKLSNFPKGPYLARYTLQFRRGNLLDVRAPKTRLRRQSQDEYQA